MHLKKLVRKVNLNIVFCIMPCHCKLGVLYLVVKMLLLTLEYLLQEIFDLPCTITDTDTNH